MSRPVLFAFVLVLAIASVHSVDAASGDACHGNDYGKSGDFGFYVFENFWGAESCHSFKSGSCKSPNSFLKQNFIIHGLWPNYNAPRSGHNWPQCCTGSPSPVTLSQDVIDQFLPNLRTIWPDLKQSNWNYDSSPFWQHEWEKHGTCSDMTQFQYFNTTTHLLSRVKTPGFVVNNIGKDVNKGDLEALYNEHPCTPGDSCYVFLRCSGGKYLAGIDTCWTRDLQPMPCPPMVNSRTCSSNIVHIPVFPY